MQTIGVACAIVYARRLGIESSLAAVPSLAVGTAEVTLLELTSAYSAFAHDGLVATPTLLRRVEDRQGGVLWQTRVAPRRAVSPETAFLVSSMLSDVIQRGTGSQARALGFKLPAAGKTGTTDDFRDVWFVGYTPHLVAGVWFGFDTPSRIMNEGFAATVAVPAWATFMKQATANDKPDAFRVPDGVQRVTLCRRSGQLATEDCRWTIEMRPEEPAPTTTIPSATTIPSPTTTGSFRLKPLPPPPGPPPPTQLVPVRVPYPNAVYEEYVRPGTVGPCTLHGPLAGARGEIRQ
jgi:penicillin-binding protein 1A